MNKFFVSLLLILGLIGFVYVVGDVVVGQVKVVVCGVCYGVDGNSLVLNFLKLVGQGECYLFKQMYDIKDGKCIVLEMIGLLINFSDQDLVDIVVYFVSQKMSVGMVDLNLVVQGEVLFCGGKIVEGMLVCIGCYFLSGVGIVIVGFLYLGGQYVIYVVKQLIDFCEGICINDGDIKIMQFIVVKLLNKDIVVIFSYIQGLY